MLNASLMRRRDDGVISYPLRRSEHPFMCRNLVVAATALAATGMIVGGAQAVTQPAPQAMTPVVSPSAAPAPPGPAPKRKASAQERVDAERLPAMARAAFWAREVNVDPTDVVANVRLASALRGLGQYSEAAESAQRALVIDPKNYDALLETARAFIGEGQGFYAIDPLTRAAAMAPKDWRPLSLLGVAYSQVKRDEDAQGVWRRALTLSHDNPAVLSNMAMALATKGDAAGAEALLRRATAQPDATLQERQNLTLVLGVEGKLTEAEKLLRDDLPPDQAEADLTYLKALAGNRAVAPTTPAVAATPHSWASLKGAGG
jgi:Flp pilus assembly protein TadD